MSTRVVTKGDVGQADSIEVISRPSHSVTVRQWFTGRNSDDARALLAADAAGELQVAAELREYLVAAVQRG